jgi:hypothetical protein
MLQHGWVLSLQQRLNQQLVAAGEAGDVLLLQAGGLEQAVGEPKSRSLT